MFLFKPIHFLKFGGKSQPQRSYKNGSYKRKRVYYIPYQGKTQLFPENLCSSTNEKASLLHFVFATLKLCDENREFEESRKFACARIK